MTISADLLRQLIEHPESGTLDVKRDQYLFLSRDNEKKSELLKDIFAFANSFIAEDAYILVGVQEKKPPPHNIVGIKTFLDEANLQQFVDGKIDNTVQFSYEEIHIDQVTVGVICIPPQNGPFFVKKDYGRLKRTRLPLRQGTSTKFVSHSEYLELAQEHARSPFVSPEARQAYAAVDNAMRNQIVRFQTFASDSVDSTFDQCSELLRLGDTNAAMAEIDRVIAQSDFEGAMSDPQRARALRIKANLLLRQNDLAGAEHYLQQADSFASEDEPRIHALVALHRFGIQAALKILGEPTTNDGRQLAAQLLISDGKPAQAIAILPDDEPRPTNTLRPRALAQLLLGDREGALATANEALQREPTWLDTLITAGMAHYFSALSPAFKPSQMFSPDPVPQPLFRADPFALEHLQIAEQHFRAAMAKRLAAHEMANTRLWLLAVLALQKQRREDANAVLTSLLSDEPTHTIGILWAVSLGLSFDRKSTRQLCLEELSGTDPLASHVVTYLVLEPEATEESLRFLEQHQHLFESEGQMVIYDHWQTRLKEETTSDSHDANSSTVYGIISDATKRGDWLGVEQFVTDNPDDPIILIIAAEALADAKQWPAVAKLAGRLVAEVSTEFAYRLAATALINTGNDRDCIAVIREWEDRYSTNQTPSVEFWRLRSTALARLGDVAGAIESVKTLLSQTGAPQDIGHAADIYLRVGDIRSAAPHITDLVRRDQLSAAEAINWSRAVQNDDQGLAEQLLDHAASKGIAPELAAAAYEMAVRLNRDDLSHELIGAVAAAADSPGTGVRSASLTDMITLMRQRRARAADVNDLYLKGQIPLALACAATDDNLALRFESAFAAYRSTEWTDALLIYHGSRMEPMPDLPDIANWIVCLDLTTLFVLDEFDLLSVLSKSTKILRFPFELPGALLEFGDQLAAGQPERLARMNDVLRALDSGDFHSDLVHPELLRGEQAVRVVFEADNADDSLPLVDLSSLIETAADRGVIDGDEAASAIAAHRAASDSRLLNELPENPVLLFSGNTIEIALDVFGLQPLCNFATCVIESNYATMIRRECQLAELRQKALARVNRLRHAITDGIQTGEYELLPQLGGDVATKHDVRTSVDAILLSLLSQPAGAGCVIGFDDRLLNRHRSTAHNPIVCTLDIIEYLRQASAISPEESLAVRARIRDANIYFAVPDAEDIDYALARTKLKDGSLAETPRLQSLRRYVARTQALQEYLDVQPTTGAPNEAPLALALFRLASKAIDGAWADEALNLKEVQARATWIWQSMHLTTDERLPLNNRTLSSVRHLLSIQLSSLLSSAMTTFMVSGREDREEWMSSQINWVWAACIEPYLEGNSELLVTIAEHMRQCVNPLLEEAVEPASEADKAEVRLATRAYVAHFLIALPTPLKECVLSDERFAERFGMGIQSVAEVSGVMVEHAVFRQSMIDSVITNTPQSFETKSGKATATLIQTGTLTRPAVIEFSGVISLKHYDPILGLLGKNRHRRFAEFLKRSDWVDLPDTELSELPEKCKNLPDEDFYDLLDQYQRSNVPHHYQLLANSMARRETLSKPDFDAPSTDNSLRMLRLPMHSRKRFSHLLDAAITSLSNQYGSVQAFERVSGLPVDLATRFVDSFSELIEQHPRKTKRWLLSPAGSVLRRLHKLALAAALTSRGLLSVASLRTALRGLLVEWKPNVELFIQVLNTTDQLLSNRISVRKLASEQHLAIVWTHAERIAGIVGDNLQPADEGIEYFRKISDRSFAASLRIDKAYETDVAVPDALFSPALLYFGMGYVHSHSHNVLSVPLMQQIDRLLRLTEDSASPLSPRILQGRTGGADSLDSILKIIDPGFRTKFNSVNDNRARSPDWFSERRFEIGHGTVPTPPDSSLWSEILAHEQRWLDPSTRLALLKYVPTVDWTALYAESEATAICTLMVIGDMISYLDNESFATAIAKDVLTACLAATPVGARDLEGTSVNAPLNFARTITEVAYRVARSSNVGRSCRVLASTLSTLANLGNNLNSKIIHLLDIAIPMLPVEDVLPLVVLQRSLRSNS